MKYVNGANAGQDVGGGLISMTPDQSISFDVGPITVLVDGLILRQERSAPLYLLGDAKDASGTPQPIGIGTLIPVGGTKVIGLIVGPNQDVFSLNITVVSPVTQLKVIRSAVDTTQHGLSTLKQQSPPPAAVIPAGGISGVDIYGYNQNISVLDPGDYVFSDGISRNSWGAGQYEGQTAYMHANWEGVSDPAKVWLGGNITFNDWIFDEAGWQKARAIAKKTQWQHCLYGNKRAPGKRFTFNRCTFARPASIGAKLMGDATVNDCVFYLCSIGIQALYGTITINNPIFYRPSYHAVAKQGGGSALVGRCAIDAYTKVLVNNPLFIGGPDDERLGNPDPSPYSIGMISASKTHTKYTDVPGADVSIIGNARAYGWPYKSGTNSLYNGDTTRFSGSVNMRSTQGKTYDPQPLFDKLYAGKMSRADFNLTLRSQLLNLET